MQNINNNVSNPQPVAVATSAALPISPRTAAVCQGLRSLSATAGQIAAYFEANPTDHHSVAEKTRAIGERLNELADGISAASESNANLRAATEDAARTSDWIGNHFPCNQSIPIYNSFNDLPQNGR